MAPTLCIRVQGRRLLGFHGSTWRQRTGGRACVAQTGTFSIRTVNSTMLFVFTRLVDPGPIRVRARHCIAYEEAKSSSSCCHSLGPLAGMPWTMFRQGFSFHILDPGRRVFGVVLCAGAMAHMPASWHLVLCIYTIAQVPSWLYRSSLYLPPIRYPCCALLSWPVRTDWNSSRTLDPG